MREGEEAMGACGAGGGRPVLHLRGGLLQRNWGVKY